MKRILHLIGMMAAALPLCAGEYAVLGNGFRLHADRHETDRGTIRLFADGGITELPAAQVTRFEQEEEVTAPKAAPATPPAVPVLPDSLTSVSTAQEQRREVAKSKEEVVKPKELASRAAQKFRLPESFVQSVMKAESAFQPGVVSPKGAIGLMQLMPQTAHELGVDPKNPEENAEGGAQYLHELLARYENDPDQVLLALAAYNAGPAAVERYHGVPPYRETRQYILRVLRNWDPAGKPTTK